MVAGADFNTHSMCHFFGYGQLLVTLVTFGSADSVCQPPKKVLSFYGRGSPRAATNNRYQSSRLSSISSAVTASRMRSGLHDPTIGMM